ncbi:MAG: hypothetical protein J0H15_01000 [Xanthomonadales bacterium]|nr:hypothetical protein [Xanthomonadales bacterium]
MASVVVPPRSGVIHPFHAVMLAGAAPMFLAALLADWAYWSSYEIQWSNFASWLLIGAMVLATIALVCAIVDLSRGARGLLYILVLAATWIVGFFDALHHGRDAWGIMPTALVLSVLVTVLAWLATWIGFSTLRTGGVR